MFRLCALTLCLFLSAPYASGEMKNVTIPLNDPDRPGCQQFIFWVTKFAQVDFRTIENSCRLMDTASRPLPLSALNAFAELYKKTIVRGDTRGETTESFFVENENGKYCSTAKILIVNNVSFKITVTALTVGSGFECDGTQSSYTSKQVCYRMVCPQPTTTSSTTTLAPSTVMTTEDPIGALRVGSLGLSVQNEILIYQIAIGLLVFFLLLFIILLLRTCYQLRRANSRHAMSDGRSHVSIRRVTEAVVDPYSSMAGIAETSSLGGPDFYGSIARRKEMSRERKAWLRDHACGGSHIGVPPPEDMNGLLPAGSIHRTSITSLTQPGGPRNIHGPNGSLSRVPGMQAPPGTYPVRPSACQLSRQNTADSLHCRSMMTPQPMMLPPSPGANGHANPLSNRDEMEGHMV